jgi:hypothetical protein
MQEQRCSGQPNLTLSNMWCGGDHFSSIPPGAQHQRPAGLLCLCIQHTRVGPQPFPPHNDAYSCDIRSGHVTGMLFTAVPEHCRVCEDTVL